MTKATTSQNNTTLKRKSKKLTWYEKYRNLNSWREKPVSVAFIEFLGKELMEWSDRDDAYKIGQFLRPKGISREVFLCWVEKYDSLKEAYNFTLSAIGDRREIGALKKELSEKTVHFTQSHYSATWRKAEERQAKLRKDSGDGDKEIVINITEFQKAKPDVAESVDMAKNRK